MQNSHCNNGNLVLTHLTNLPRPNDLELFCPPSQRSCGRGILDYPSSVLPSVRPFPLNCKPLPVVLQVTWTLSLLQATLSVTQVYCALQASSSRLKKGTRGHRMLCYVPLSNLEISLDQEWAFPFPLSLFREPQLSVESYPQTNSQLLPKTFTPCICPRPI